MVIVWNRISSPFCYILLHMPALTKTIAKNSNLLFSDYALYCGLVYILYSLKSVFILTFWSLQTALIFAAALCWSNASLKNLFRAVSASGCLLPSLAAKWHMARRKAACLTILQTLRRPFSMPINRKKWQWEEWSQTSLNKSSVQSLDSKVSLPSATRNARKHLLISFCLWLTVSLEACNKYFKPGFLRFIPTILFT